jgi:hypothetical protein
MTRCPPVRLRGLAARAGEREQPIGSDVTIPASVPVLLQFSVEHIIGTAILHRDAAGNIHADAMVYPDSDPLLRKGLFGPGRNPWPYFALSIAHAVLTRDDAHPAGVITGGEILHLALVDRNADLGLPRYVQAFDVVAEAGQITAVSVPGTP